MSASPSLKGHEIKDVLVNAISDYDEKNLKSGGPLFPTNAVSYLIKCLQAELDKKGEQ